MDEATRQHELDDVDAGLTAQEVLQRTAAVERDNLNQSLADLSALATDEEIFDTYGVDMTAMRSDLDWSRVWSLP